MAEDLYVNKKSAWFFIKYPLTNLASMLKIILFGLVPILNLVSLGYILFAARNIYEKNFEMPDFNEYSIRSYFLAGIYALFIGIVYAIPTVILLLLMFMLGSAKILIMSLFIGIALIPLGIISMLMASAALMRFIETESLSEAIDLRENWEMIDSSFVASLLWCSIVAILWTLPAYIFGTILMLSKPELAASLNIVYLVKNFSYLALIRYYIFGYMLFIPLTLASRLCFFSHFMHQIHNKKAKKEGLKKGWTISALILSIFGLGFFPLAIIGLIFGIVAIVKAKHNPENYSGKGIAIVAIVIAILSLALWASIFFIGFKIISTFMGLQQLKETAGNKTTFVSPNGLQDLDELQEKIRKKSTKDIARANQLSFESAEGCTDSDSGKNYYARGYSSGYYENLVNKRKAEDFCMPDKSNILGEQYCDGDVLKIEYFTCVNGCIDGACR